MPFTWGWGSWGAVAPSVALGRAGEFGGADGERDVVELVGAALVDGLEDEGVGEGDAEAGLDGVGFAVGLGVFGEVVIEVLGEVIEEERWV